MHRRGTRDDVLTEALAEVGLLVNEHLGRDHVAKRHECLCQVAVRELLRQVVDKQVGPLGTCVQGGGGGKEALCPSIKTADPPKDGLRHPNTITLFYT